jgi:hypothetical protein
MTHELLQRIYTSDIAHLPKAREETAERWGDEEHE